MYLFVWERFFYNIVLILILIDFAIGFYRIYTKKYGVVGENSLLWEKATNGGVYRAEDFLSDLKYLKIVLSERGRWNEVGQVTVIFITLLHFLKHLPFIFVFMFMLCTVFNVATLVIKVYRGGGEIELMRKLALSPDSTWCELLTCVVKLPFYWSWAMLYLVLGVKKKKINKEVIYLYVFSYVVQKPMWFLKTILKMAYGVWSLTKNKEFREKSPFLWPKIATKALKFALFELLKTSYFNLYNLLVGNRIRVVGRTITLNPSNFKDFLMEFGLAGLEFKFNKLRVIVFNGQSHVLVMSADGKLGFVMTTSSGFGIDGVKVESKPLSLERMGQKFIFCSLDKQGLEITEGSIYRHFENNRWVDFENMAGMFIRLNILYKHGLCNSICHQGTASNYVGSIQEDTYERVYKFYEEAGNWNTRERVNSRIVGERNDVLNEFRKGLMDKMFETTNKELYSAIKEESELLDAIKEIKKETEAHGFNWDDL